MSFIQSSFADRVTMALFAVAMLLLPVWVSAQENETVEAPEAIEGIVIANINLSDATVLSQNADQLMLEFTLTNQGESPQFDIRYGVEMVKELSSGGQAVVDGMVGRETLTLSGGQSLTKVVEYPLSGVAPGTYSVWITARTVGGVMLGLGNAGSITVVAADVVEIKADTCSLSIAGAEGKYSVFQGVDVDATESLVLNCTLKNHGFNNRTVVPLFETYKRTIFGGKLMMDYPVEKPIVIASGAEEIISLTIPKALEAQAYDASVVLIDSTTRRVVSNRVVVHYVVKGDSATIQNISLNKESYVAGEEIEVVFLWSAAADAFEDSRLGGTEVTGVQASLQVVSSNGNICVDKTFQLAGAINTVKAASLTDCPTPATRLTLTASDGTVLDTRLVSSVSSEGIPQIAPVPTVTKEKNSLNALMWVTFTAFAIALITILLVVGRRKRVSVAE